MVRGDRKNGSSHRVEGSGAGTKGNGGSGAADEHDRREDRDRVEEVLDRISVQVASAWYAVGLLSGAIMKHKEEWGEAHSGSLTEVMQHVSDKIVGPYIYNTTPPQEEKE